MGITRRDMLLSGLAGLALSGCQVAPGTGRSSFNLLSEDDERQLGRQTHPQILQEFGGAYDDPTLAAYIAGLGQRLVRVCETPDAEFRFTVLDSPIVNAMALPGGYIYITRGLLALTSNEAEVAGVLGHEIGHVLARHTAERVSRAQAGGLFAAVLGAVVGVQGVGELAQMGAAAYLQSFSRDQESEADHLGLRYLVRAGWHPQAMVSMLEKLRDQARLEALMAGRSPDSIDQLDFMASHPRTIDRVNATLAEVMGAEVMGAEVMGTEVMGTEVMGAAPQGALGADTFLDRVDGVVYGDGIDQGVVRDRVFLHPALDLRFEVPTGFRLVNGAKAVIATHPSGAAILFDGAPARGVQDMAQYISRVWLQRSHLSGLENIEIGDMPAATAATRGRTRQGEADVRVVAIRYNAETIYRFTFVTPLSQTAALSADLRRTTYSFRRPSAEERASAKPWRLRVVRVQAGDTVDKLAARMPPGQWQAELFRVINGLGPDQQPAVGARVKLVMG